MITSKEVADTKENQEGVDSNTWYRYLVYNWTTGSKAIFMEMSFPAQEASCFTGTRFLLAAIENRAEGLDSSASRYSELQTLQEFPKMCHSRLETRLRSGSGPGRLFWLERPMAPLPSPRSPLHLLSTFKKNRRINLRWNLLISERLDAT
jgi:hypothetical protein